MQSAELKHLCSPTNCFAGCSLTLSDAPAIRDWRRDAGFVKALLSSLFSSCCHRKRNVWKGPSCSVLILKTKVIETSHQGTRQSIQSHATYIYTVCSHVYSLYMILCGRTGPLKN